MTLSGPMQPVKPGQKTLLGKLRRFWFMCVGATFRYAPVEEKGTDACRE